MHSLPLCRLCHSANRKGDFLRKQLSKKAGVQILFLLLGLAFLVCGVMRGEADTVLNKAIKLCLECVEIGRAHV